MSDGNGITDNNGNADNGDPSAPHKTKFSYPTMASIYKMDSSNICTMSTEGGFKCVWPKWDAFCKGKGISSSWAPNHGLQLFSKRTNVMDADDYDHQLLDSFFTHLKDSPGVGSSIMTKAKTFCNMHLKCEHYNRLKEAGKYPNLQDFSVGKKSKVIKNCCKTVSEGKASAAMEGCKDIHVGLKQLVSVEGQRAMTESVFCPKPGGSVEKLGVLHRLYWGCHQWTSSATVRRGEELYQQRLIQRAKTFLKEIGPRGVFAPLILTNHAKHNKTGWLEYAITLPHNDPTKNSASYHGATLAYRIHIRKEVLPSFVEAMESLEFDKVFGVWTYPSDRDPSEHINARKYGDNFADFKADEDVVCAKLAHQPRFQAIQEMDRAGLSRAIQFRMAGHKGEGHTVHDESYANNPPPAGLVQRAGGDPNDLRAFDPVHFIPTPKEQLLLDEIVLGLAPTIVEECATIQAVYDKEKSHKKRLELRLFTLLGTLEAMVHDLEQFVLMMASPTVNPETYRLVADTRSLWEMYHNDGLAALLNLPPFHTAAFVELQKSTLEKMQKKQQHLVPLDDEAKGAMERCLIRHVARPLAAFHQQFEATIARSNEENEIRVRRCEEMLELALTQRTSTSTSVAALVTPMRHGRSPAHTSVVQTANEEDDREPIPLSVMTLADGCTPRKRRPAIRQETAISHQYKRREQNGVIGNDPALEVLKDSSCASVRDLWSMYKKTWKPLEISTCGEWRKDFVNPDGRKNRSRSQFWTQRSGLFRVIEHYMNELSMSEEEAIQKAEEIWNSVDVGKRGKKPPIKEVSKAFKAELQKLNISHRGRPKGRKTSGSKRGRTSSTEEPDEPDAFAAAFNPDNIDTPLMREIQERVQREKEVEDGRWEDYHRRRRFLEDRHRQMSADNNAGYRWEYTNRYNRGPLPPVPPDCGRLHPPPWRPVPNQPPLMYPPGHHEATLPQLPPMEIPPTPELPP